MVANPNTAQPILTAEDWIICVAQREERGLRQCHPDAMILSSNVDALRGLTVRGRVFITAQAEQRVSIDRVRDALGPCAATTGADLTIHRIGG